MKVYVYRGIDGRIYFYDSKQETTSGADWTFLGTTELNIEPVKKTVKKETACVITSVNDYPSSDVVAVRTEGKLPKDAKNLKAKITYEIEEQWKTSNSIPQTLII